MARDEVNLSLIVDGPRKRKLAAHITSEDNVSADKDYTTKRLRQASIKVLLAPPNVALLPLRISKMKTLVHEILLHETRDTFLSLLMTKTTPQILHPATQEIQRTPQSPASVDALCPLKKSWIKTLVHKTPLHETLGTFLNLPMTMMTPRILHIIEKPEEDAEAELGMS